METFTGNSLILLLPGRNQIQLFFTKEMPLYLDIPGVIFTKTSEITAYYHVISDCTRIVRAWESIPVEQYPRVLDLARQAYANDAGINMRQALVRAAEYFHAYSKVKNGNSC